ncbi:hypothetical protein KUCAC02_006248, partial [Chaenocephalus aceratus]
KDTLIRSAPLILAARPPSCGSEEPGERLAYRKSCSLCTCLALKSPATSKLPDGNVT